ncbi:WG repeat-containing protein [Flavobacterium chungnamense]|uniref:WG repeat-containing protein n=1 Tax=Flavobacterium chungnamense TaxID=706182 RepID=A0ABP7V4N8_9FLAO
MKKTLFLLLISLTIYAQKPINSNVLIPYRNKNLWGLSDTLGNIKVKPIYKDIKDFFIDKDTDFTSMYAVKTNKSYFVIDRNGKVIIPETYGYDSIYVNKFYYDRFLVYKKGKMGLYKNKELIPCIYDKVEIGTNESYYVKMGKLSGLINAKGKLIIPVLYDDVHPSFEEKDDYNSEYVWVAEKKNEEKKFYDFKIPTKLDRSMYEKNIVEEANSNDDDSDKEELFKAKLKERYDKVNIVMYYKVAYVEKNNKKGLVELPSLKEIISPIYEELSSYGWDNSEIVYKVKLNNKYGFVKPGNVTILNCEFDEIEDLGILIKDGKKGYYTFNSIYPYIQPKYLSIKNYDDIDINDTWQFKLFEVTTEKGKGYVGENGVEFFKD